MLSHHVGRVIAIYEVPPNELTTQVAQAPRAHIVQIAFPEVNVGAQLPMLWTMLLGNDVSTSAQLKLLDLQLSPSLARLLAGPRFGIGGIRALVGVQDRPLILNVIKPNLGFSAETGANMFAESARGGSDIIKDDELLGNPSFLTVSQRVKVYMQAGQRVYEETGHRALYCVNITDRPDRVLESARRAAELGADMVMVNAVSTGLGILQALADMPNFSLPLLAHYAGASSLTEAPASGISSPLLLGKLMRLCGADASSFNSPYSAYPLLREKYVQTAEWLRSPLYEIQPSLPVPGGGIHPATAEVIINDLGYDVLLAVGGAIQGHPQGATAGARAMRQAIDAIVAGIPLIEHASGHAELGAALNRWGHKVN
jgi:2,3-diketo-5-methylthiopentyl-1-phosphate enolase